MHSMAMDSSEAHSGPLLRIVGRIAMGGQGIA